MSQPFPPGSRTYHVSDERLRAFKMLTPEQKLRWVEDVSTFLRLAKIDLEKQQDGSKQNLAEWLKAPFPYQPILHIWTDRLAREQWIKRLTKICMIHYF
jgi:hypothetical protein